MKLHTAVVNNSYALALGTTVVLFLYSILHIWMPNENMGGPFPTKIHTSAGLILSTAISVMLISLLAKLA